MVSRALLYVGYVASSVPLTLAMTVATIVLVERGGLLPGGLLIAANAVGAVGAVVATSAVAKAGRSGWMLVLVASSLAGIGTAVAAVAGAPLAAILAIKAAGGFTGRVASYLYRAEIHRAEPGPVLLSRMTAANASTRAVAVALAGWGAVALSVPAMYALLAVSVVGFAPVFRVAWLATGAAAPAAVSIGRDTARRLALPALSLLVGWSVISGFAHLHVAVATDWLGAGWVGAAGATYAAGAWAAPVVLRRRPRWTARTWLMVAAATHLLWVLPAYNPWLLLAVLPAVGAAAHAAQSACEATLPAIAGRGREAGAFAVSNGMLVISGAWTPPAAAMLLEQVPLVPLAVVAAVVAVAVTSTLRPLAIVTVER